MPTARRRGQCAEEIRTAVETFLASSREPALLEPGEELLPLGAGNCIVALSGPRVTIQAWDRTRNLLRRVTATDDSKPGRLELTVERFGRREGQVFLLDLSRRSSTEAARRGSRLVFRERFRFLLRRQFPDWTLAEVSTEANLEHSLSPAFPRGFLRHGQLGWAAIACPPEGNAAACVSFGLIWLSYLRRREARLTVQGLALYVPEGHEQAPALRLLCLDREAARFDLFSYNASDHVSAIDPRDHGNLDTRLEPCQPAVRVPEPWQSLLGFPGVEAIPHSGGRVSFRVRGIEFAALSGERLEFGLDKRHAASAHHLPEIERLAAELDRARNPEAAARELPLYRSRPEAWLESAVRAHIETIHAGLLTEPVYGQVPAFAGGERGVLDLLAVDRDGRLAVIELKASPDLHLPTQALDYWVRVKWHLDRGEFSARGYFPGIELRRDPPRLILVCPSLEFHPATETLLGYFSPLISVERIGLAVEWRKELRVMFRLAGAERPQ
jgi:hypothetical protein